MASLFRNTFFQTLAHGWHFLMAIVLFKAATVRLGEAGFGKYALGTTIMYFILLFSDFGVNTLVTREIARDPARSESVLARALGLKLLLIAVGLVFLLLYSTFTRYDAETDRVIWIFCAYGFASSFTQLGFSVFRAQERMQYEALVAMTEKTLSTGLCVLALLLGWGLIPFSLLFAATGFASLAMTFWLVRSRFHPVRIETGSASSVAMFRSAFAFGCAMFITYAYDKVALLVLSWVQNLEAVGAYAAASRLLSFTSLVPTVFGTAFFPRFASVATDRRELSRVFTLGLKHLLMLAIPLVPGVFLVSDRLILLFADARFADAANVLRILSLPAGLLFVNVFWASLYGAVGRQRTMLLIEIVGLSVNIAANLILIPRFSYAGAAWATLLTESLVFTAASAFALLRLVKLTESSFLVKIAGSAAAMSLFLLAFPGLPAIPAVLSAAALYLALLLATGALDFSSLKPRFTGIR